MGKKQYPILKYSYEDILMTATKLANGGYETGTNGLSINRHVVYKAADMLENMVETLKEWDKYAGFLAAHGMLDSNENRESQSYTITTISSPEFDEHEATIQRNTNELVANYNRDKARRGICDDYSL